MRRILCVIIMFMLLLCACAANEEAIAEPVSFFYRTKNITYGSNDGVVCSEVQEGLGLSSAELLQLYFRGPTDNDLFSPFPAGTELVSYSKTGKIVDVTLTDQFAQLSGYELTLGGACLAKTVCQLDDAQVVIVRMLNATFDGKPFLAFNMEDLVFLDQNTAEEVIK